MPTMTLRRTAPALVALVLSATVPLQAQKEAPPAPGIPKAFRVPPHKTVTLPNGMKLTMVRYGVVPKVTVSLQVGTGGIDEGPEEIQLSALTADLLLEGTATRSATDISRQAAEMGGALSAFSSDDAVSLGGEVLAEFAEPFLGLVADVVQHPRFAAADVDRLRGNRARDNAIALTQAGQITRAKFRQMIFGDHPYGRIYPTDAMLQSYTAERVRAFHAANFGARRAHLYVSGVFDPVRVERTVRAAFSGWNAGNAPTINPPAPRSARQLELIDRPDAVQSSLRVGLPVADPSSPDWVRLSVTDAILGGSFGSRITSNIREDKGYTYSPFSFVGAWPGTGLWVEVADVTTNVTGPSLKEIFGEVNRLRSEAPSDAELGRIKNNMAGLFTIQNSSRFGVIGQLQFVDQYHLGDGYLAGYVQRVLAVTSADVQQTAVKYLDPAKMTIAVVGDKKTVEGQLEPYRSGVP